MNPVEEALMKEMDALIDGKAKRAAAVRHPCKLSALWHHRSAQCLQVIDYSPLLTGAYALPVVYT